MDAERVALRMENVRLPTCLASAVRTLAIIVFNSLLCPPLQSPIKESSHLCFGDRSARAIAERLGFAADRYFGSRQGVYIIESPALFRNIGETGRTFGIGQIKSSIKESCHLRTRDGAIRTVAQRFRLATVGYAQIAQAINEVHPILIVINIRKSRFGYLSRILTVKDTHQPNGHLPALQRLPRTETLFAVGAFKNAFLLQGGDDSRYQPLP